MSTKRTKTPLVIAGERHLESLERLAQADTIFARRKALEHAVATFERFIDALEKGKPS